MAEYIEREKLIEHLKKDPLFELVERYGITGVIASIPAADVRPVVRGKWITVKHPLYECSICGAVYQDVGYGFNYCPNCGARMWGE